MEIRKDILPVSGEISNEIPGSIEYQNLTPGSTIIVTDEVTMNRIVEQKIKDSGFGDQIKQNKTSLGELSTKYDDIKRIVTENTNKAESNKQNINSASGKITGIEGSITELTRQQSETSSKVSTIESAQSLFQTGLDGASGEIQQIKSDISQGRTEVSKLSKKITTNEGSITSLTSRVEQNEQEITTIKQSSSEAVLKASQATQSATEAGVKADSAVQKAETTKTLVGDINGLNVSNKTSVSGALNEVINVVNDNKSKVEETKNKIGDLSSTGLPSQNQTTVVAGIKYLKDQVDNIEREQTSNRTNIERRLDAVEAKAEINSNSMRYIGTLAEDKDTVEAKAGTKNAWLDAQVSVLKPGETAHNGNFILTSDGHTYHRYGDTWLLELKNDNTISIANDSTQGIMKGKSDKGHGYIGSTGDGDGTFKLVDYDDIKRSIDEKATSRSVSDLEAKVDKKTGDYSTLSLSGSDSGKPVSVVEIANAILGIIGSLSSISGVNNSTIANAINGVLGKLSTTDSNVDAKMPKSGGNFTGSVTIDRSVSSFSDNDIFPLRHLKTFLGDFSTVDVSSKNTITEILKHLLTLINSNTTEITGAKDKIGGLDTTGIPPSSQTSVSTSLKYLNDQYTTLNQNYTSNKTTVEGRLDDLTLKVNANSNSMKFIGTLSVDKNTVEGKGGGRDAWLDLQVPVLKPGLTAMNGSIIMTSDGHTYYRTGDAWVLKEEKSIELATDRTAGIMKGKSDLGYGYICSTGDGDGTFKLADYQNLKQAIDGKGEKSVLDGVKSSLETKTGDYTSLNLSGSSNGKPASVVEIANAILGLIGGLSSLSTSAKDNIVNAINELKQSLTTINGDMSNYMPKSGGEFTNNVTMSSSIVSFNPNDLIPKRHLTGVLGDFSSLNVSSKGTVTEALNSLLDLIKANTTKIGQNNDKIGDLSTTGLPQQNQTSVTESLKYVKTEIDAVKQKQTQDKQNLTSRLDTLTNKVNVNSSSMRYIGTLSEDKDTVEAKGAGRDAWLNSQVGVLKPGETAQNGNIILTSDKHAYHRYGDAWFLVEKDSPITLGTDNDAGLIKGKDEKGHGYIKSTGHGDGTFELVDYQDLKDSIDLKATQTDVTSLTSRVGTVEGELAKKVNSSTLTQDYYTKTDTDGKLRDKLNISTYNSDKTTFATTANLSTLSQKVTTVERTVSTQGSSISDLSSKLGNLKNTGLAGSTVTELLADAKTKIDGINMSNYYPISDTYNKTEVDRFVAAKADASTVILNNADQTTSGKITSTSGFKVEKANPSIELRDNAGNKSTVIQTIDNGENLQFSVGDGTGAVQFNGKLRYPQNSIPTVTADGEIPSLKQIKDTFATITNLNLKANEADVVKLTGDQSIDGNKTFTSKVEINANNEVLKLKNTSNTSNYIAGYEGNIRIYYIGKDASDSIDLSIKNEYSVNGWITLKTKSKFDQAYTITDNNQIVHKKYVDDTINTNCVKLTGNQDIAGNKTFSGSSKFTGFIDVDAAPYNLSTNNYCMLRFVGDKWSSGQSADLIRFHKFGPVCGYKVYLNGTGFNYAEIYGQTLISNMKDPTADAHGANKRYVDGKIGTLTSLTTTNKTNVVNAINEVNDNMPVVLPAGTQPTTSNIGSMKVAFVLK